MDSPATRRRASARLALKYGGRSSGGSEGYHSAPGGSSSSTSSGGVAHAGSRRPASPQHARPAASWLTSHHTVHRHARYPFVLHNYRSHESTVFEALRSVVSWHNETINIWTHLLGFLHYAILSPFLIADLHAVGAHDEDIYWFRAFLIGVQVQMFSSMLYHIFTCLPEKWAEAVLRLDLMGVAGVILFQLALSLHLTFACLPDVRDMYLAVLFVLLGASSLLSLYPDLPAVRPWLTSLFVLGAGCGAVFSAHGSFVQHHAVLPAVMLTPLLVYLFFALGFVFYVCNIPERWLPGTFDIVGSSHQWWHSFIFAGSAACCYGCWHIVHLRATLAATGDQCSHLT